MVLIVHQNVLRADHYFLAGEDLFSKQAHNFCQLLKFMQTIFFISFVFQLIFFLGIFPDASFVYFLSFGI